ncbi:MAG: efflux RND transporter periplasmic adaptor subunit [Marinilabiliales bacterium]|nr:efflux RND transporter periplasmic adaptor subunit [Marinilabiliales bacterium]
MKRMDGPLWLTVLAMGLIVSCGKETKKNPQQGEGRNLLVVEGVLVKTVRMDFSYAYTGTLMANEEIDVRPEISAKVTGIFFKEGSAVKKGETLVKMFDSDLQAQLKSNILQQQLSWTELERKRELYRFKGISKEELDIAENNYNTLRAAQDLINAQISKTELHAPFSGIVGLRMVSEGAFVSNSTIITSLQQVDPIKVDFSVPEKFLANLAVGKEISFSVDGRDGNYSAKIYALESKIDASTRSIRVRALCNNPNRELYPGAFAKISLKLFADKESLMIPAKSTVPLMEGEQVFVVKNGKARAVDIKTGYRTEKEVEVTDGIAPNDTLITSGLLQVKDGMAVRAKISNK